MDRRSFAAGIGAAAASLAVARAQPARMPVIGYLNSTSPGLYTFIVDAFREGLREAGFIEGRNVAIEYRWAGGDYGRLPALAAELVALNVQVIAATGDVASARAAQAATQSIPVIFTIGGDPIRFGLVQTMNRPGGNVTGVSMLSNVLGQKRVQLLHGIAPRASRVALLMNPGNPNAAAERRDAEEGARALGLATLALDARDETGIDAAFAAVAREGADSLITATDPLLIARREQIVDHERRLRLPAVHTIREFTAIGGLMNYGPSLTGMYRQAGLYVGRILKGARPAELPVMQPTHFHMAINLATARALDLAVPPQLAALADDLIE
jgi:putative ABC transport system substrate-binding protein